MKRTQIHMGISAQGKITVFPEAPGKVRVTHLCVTLDGTNVPQIEQRSSRGVLQPAPQKTKETLFSLVRQDPYSPDSWKDLDGRKILLEKETINQ